MAEYTVCINHALTVRERWRVSRDIGLFVNVYTPCDLRCKQELWEKLRLTIVEKSGVFVEILM